LGSRVVDAHLVRDIMRLAFLLERSYAPYSKWIGSAFKRLTCAPVLGAYPEGVLAANTYADREAHLVRAYDHVAHLHNQPSVTAPVPAALARFYQRPYLVIDADQFVAVTEQAIRDVAIRAWPRRIGSVNQSTDATDVLDRPSLLATLRPFYERTPSQPVGHGSGTANYPARHPLDE
jgi:hypothetical protein